MHSLVASCMCPDWGLNLQRWIDDVSGWCSTQLSYLARAASVLNCLFWNCVRFTEEKDSTESQCWSLGHTSNSKAVAGHLQSKSCYSGQSFCLPRNLHRTSTVSSSFNSPVSSQLVNLHITHYIIYIRIKWVSIIYSLNIFFQVSKQVFSLEMDFRKTFSFWKPFPT